MKKIFLTLFVALSILSFSKKVEIVMLETSDIHGRLFSYEYAVDEQKNNNGLTRIATLIKQQRNDHKNVILLDNGDLLQDNSAELFNNESVHPLIRAINDLKFDMFTLGNHEFNFEKDFLDRNIKGFNGDVLACNVLTDDGKYYVKPYVIKNIDGVRVAVVGYLVPHIPIWEASTPDHYKGLHFLSPEEALPKVLKELEGKYDVLVGSFHLGREDERGGTGVLGVAEKFPQFDIIFAGHEHAIYNTLVGKTHVIEPGAYGTNLAKATIIFDTNTKEKDIVTENIETKNVPEDKELVEKYSYVQTIAKKYSNQKVGKVTETFILNPDFITGEDKITTMPTASIMETPVITLINDVQKFYANADISSAALFNFGSNLKRGDFKRKDVAFIYKYANTLVGVNITGENLLKYMEWSARYYNQLKPGDVTISFNKDIRGYNYDMFSGINYGIDITKPEGERIVNPTINGEPIKKDKIYKLAVNNYRFGTLTNLGLVTDADKYYDSSLETNGGIRDLIVKYIVEQKNGLVYPREENNWKIINYDFNNPLLEVVRQKVKSGELTIPTSEDKRTLNVRSVTEDDLK